MHVLQYDILYKYVHIYISIYTYNIYVYNIPIYYCGIYVSYPPCWLVEPPPWIANRPCPGVDVPQVAGALLQLRKASRCFGWSFNPYWPSYAYIKCTYIYIHIM